MDLIGKFSRNKAVSPYLPKNISTFRWIERENIIFVTNEILFKTYT